MFKSLIFCERFRSVKQTIKKESLKPSPLDFGMQNSCEVKDVGMASHGQTVDHVIPLSVCPELDNQVLNLELLPASLNSSKRDKVTERAKAFAKELYDAKLLSDTSWERIQLAEWKRLILSE